MITDLFSHKWKIESNLYSLDFGIKNIHQNDNPRILTVNSYKKKIYVFILFWAVVGLCCSVRAFLQLRQAGATLRRSAQASHCGAFSCLKV